MPHYIIIRSFVCGKIRRRSGIPSVKANGIRSASYGRRKTMGVFSQWGFVLC